MPRIYSALILDDDPNSIMFMKWFIDEHFPWVRVAAGTEAMPAKGFDIYFIDNNFNGKAKAVDIVSDIRRTDSRALIIAYSATLSRDTYKSLMNAGCNGAVEKGNLKDVRALRRMTKDYIGLRDLDHSRERKHGLGFVVQSMADLIKQWNQSVNGKEKKEVRRAARV